MSDRVCRRCSARTPARLVARDRWGERCWGCGDADSCVDAPGPASLPTRVARNGDVTVALNHERDPYRLAGALMRERRLWGSAASYAGFVMAHYRRYVGLVAGHPAAERDALIALGARAFVGVHRRTLRRDVERAQAAQAATP